ncbi:hypothetical protein SMC26_22845 [Actinomadura fulvescens]|uniref:Uncharacterized protein n=1 Tax=Actinomadura fulvescens TaxID=46160 RepID=A0ABN3QXY4_9ACTN
MNYVPAWDDPGSAWWAKADRARIHLDELSCEIAAFRDSSPYSVTPELTDVTDRLKFHQPFPVHFSTIVGDVVNNLRGALECLAFEVARQCHGGHLTAAQTRASSFPICKTPAAFEEFFTKKPGLYDERARKAFWAVQPFFIELAREYGVDVEVDYDERWAFAPLPRLNNVWNLDKHRRLALMAWWPHLLWWGSNGPTNRRMLPGDGTLADGSVLICIEGQDEGQGTEISHAAIHAPPPPTAITLPSRVEPPAAYAMHVERRVTRHGERMWSAH